MIPRLSFIVPVRNDAARLEVCLRAILQTRASSAPIEIVVVDNGSTDASPIVAERLGARVVVIEKVRVSELRNRASRVASGQLLAFIDADNEIVPGWVDAALELFDGTSIGAAGAVYRPPANGTWVQRGFGLLRGLTRGQQDVTWLSSGNLVVTREAFEAVGGFDTTLETCEDVDLCHRIRARGYRMIGDARLGSTHHGDPTTLRDLFRSELWRGRDNLRVTFRRPISWSAVPSAMIPVIDLLMIGLFGAGAISFVGGWTAGLALVALALLLFCAGASLRLVRAAAKQERTTLLDLAQGFIISCVFDLARALALVSRAPHRNVRPRTAAAAS